MSGNILHLSLSADSNIERGPIPEQMYKVTLLFPNCLLVFKNDQVIRSPYMTRILLSKPHSWRFTCFSIKLTRPLEGDVNTVAFETWIKWTCSPIIFRIRERKPLPNLLLANYCKIIVKLMPMKHIHSREPAVLKFWHKSFVIWSSNSYCFAMGTVISFHSL